MPTHKNIVWITPGFAADEKDSQCIPPLQLLAKELAKEKSIRLQIITLHYPFKSTPYSWNGISIFPCFKKGIFSKKRSWIQALKYFHQLNKKEPIDVVHSFWLTDAALLAYWSSRFLGIKHWVTLAGQDARSSNRYLHLFPLKKIRTIAVSSFHANVWKKTTGLDAHLIIPWGISPIEKTPDSVERTIDILGVGNLIELKNYALFIEMVKQLKHHFPKIKTVIIGDGKQRNFLQKKIQQENLTDHVQLAGSLSRNEVMEYMQQTKVFFHPSTYESFGFVFVEALANGTQIISRPVGIAEASERWQIGNTSDVFFEKLKNVLEKSNSDEADYPYPISETLRKYLEIYHSSELKTIQ